MYILTVILRLNYSCENTFASFINYVTLKSGFHDHPLPPCYAFVTQPLTPTHLPRERYFLLNLEIEEQKKTALNAEFVAQTSL